MAKKKAKKKKTAKKAKRRTAKRTARKLAPKVRHAPKGYAYMVKIGDDYLTDNGDYSLSQSDARQFTVRPNPATAPKISGDHRRPRVVRLHLRASSF